MLLKQKQQLSVFFCFFFFLFRRNTEDTFSITFYMHLKRKQLVRNINQSQGQRRFLVTVVSHKRLNFSQIESAKNLAFCVQLSRMV